MRLINPDISGVYTGDNIDGMVREYMRNIAHPDDGLPYVPNSTLFERVQIPEFGSDRDKEAEFWSDQIYKWRYGDGDMPGMHHTYFHHGWIRKRSGGRLRPDFRRHDMVTFDLMESMVWGQSRWFGDRRGRGAIELGKRGSGKSNRVAMMQITAASLRDAVDLGFTANSESTVKKFLDDKPKFIWSNLPDPMRATAQRNSILRMWFGEMEKDAQGNTVRRGKDSNIICRSPFPEAFESLGLFNCTIDEAPKTKALRLIFDMTDPCLSDDQGFEREGFWWITGVAGDFDKHGQDFIEMWETAEALKLDRVFIPGWAGMECDAYGNEDVEKAVRRILQERSLYQDGTEELFRRIQQFPLTPEECFLDAKEAPMPTQQIRRALHTVYAMPQMYRTCDIDFEGDNPRLVDDPRGRIQVLEGPLADASYAVAVDPFGYKMKFQASNQPGKNGEGSSGGLVIHKAPIPLAEAQREEIIEQIYDPATDDDERLQLRLSLGGLPVLRFLDKPQNPDDFARRAAAVIRMYGWRALVERVPSNVIEYFINEGLKDFLFWEPFKKPKSRLTKADFATYGIQMNEHWVAVRLQALYSWYERYADWVYFPDMLENALHYNPAVQRKKFDDLDAHGMCFIQMQDPRFTVRGARVVGGAEQNGALLLPFRTVRS